MLEKTFEFAKSLTAVWFTQSAVVDPTAGNGHNSLSLAEEVGKSRARLRLRCSSSSA